MTSRLKLTKAVRYYNVFKHFYKLFRFFATNTPRFNCCGGHINYRMDRNIFGSYKLEARTKRTVTRLLETQYANDCAVRTHCPEELHTDLTEVATLSRSLSARSTLL